MEYLKCDSPAQLRDFVEPLLNSIETERAERHRAEEKEKN